jgi:membrane fusion protein, heavy metal efflux system
MTNHRSKYAPFFYLLLVGVALSLQMLGCSASGNKSAASANGSNPSQSGDRPQLFRLNSDELAHVKVVTIAPTSISRSLRLTGAIAFNGFNTTPVISQVSGPVSRIAVTPGQQVHRGEPLLYVTSPDYSQSLANYLKTRDAFHLADRNYLRSKDLYDHHAIAERDLEAAESARAQAAADLGSSEQSLRILGISKPDEVVGKPTTAEIPVLAPIAGEAVERLVEPGQVIQAGATQAFTISNTGSVWVLANVYQQDLPHVHIGDPATITTDAYPGVEFHGKIQYIAAALDPSTRTLQARIDVRNPDGKLKKDMYVVATIQAGTIHDAIAVPMAAVLRDAENQPFVYVINEKNEYARRPVTLGESNSEGAQVTSGLNAGERVVADGSLFLQFASSLQR